MIGRGSHHPGPGEIRTDKADIGWSMTTVMADAQAGTGQFEGKKTDKGHVPRPHAPSSACNPSEAFRAARAMAMP